MPPPTTVPDFRREEQRIRDAYAAWAPGNRYAWSEPGHVFLMHGVERALVRCLAGAGAFPLGERRVLEVGCGSGQWLREFCKWGARPERVIGIDLLAGRLAIGRDTSPPELGLVRASAARLPFHTGTFDISCQLTAFTSMLDPALRCHAAAEMLRVTRPDGFIIWYDFAAASPRNRAVRPVGRRELHRLFPDCRLRVWRVTLAPPIGRWLAARSWLLATLASTIPLLRTHLLAVIRRSDGRSAR